VIQARDLFPDKKEREYVKSIIDMFNGHIVMAFSGVAVWFYSLAIWLHPLAIKEVVSGMCAFGWLLCLIAFINYEGF